MRTRLIYELDEYERMEFMNDFADILLDKYGVSGSISGCYDLYRALLTEFDKADDSPLGLRWKKNKARRDGKELKKALAAALTGPITTGVY